MGLQASVDFGSGAMLSPPWAMGKHRDAIVAVRFTGALESRGPSPVLVSS